MKATASPAWARCSASTSPTVVLPTPTVPFNQTARTAMMQSTRRHDRTSVGWFPGPGTVRAVPIVPDDKNWTWVLERDCPECGFDAASIEMDELPQRIRENAAMWAILLADPQAQRRPSDDRWSALEYGCHVRDVFRLFHERLRLMLAEDAPRFSNWDQDAHAIEDRYGEQDPAVVAEELAAAAEEIASAFGAVLPDEWERPGVRSDGAVFTVESFARYFLHDPVHHVHDVVDARPVG